MSLVAYDNSDVSSDDEGEDESDNVKSSTPFVGHDRSEGARVVETKFSQKKIDFEEIDCPKLARALPKPKGVNLPFDEEDITKRLLFSSSPLHINSSTAVTLNESKSDGLSKVRNQKANASSSSVVKKTVKITLPSLSKFSDEEEESKPKKLKPSTKGSGLFSLLPAPKNLVVKENNRKLIPRVVSKPPIVNKVARTSGLANKRKPESLISYPDSGEESGEEENEVDFFSLTASPSEEICSDSTSVSASLDENLIKRQVENPSLETENSSAYGESSQPTTIPSIAHQQSSEEACVSELPDSSHESHGTNTLQLDEEAIHRLCGRRGREEILDAQVIDVCGETHLPDPKEWLVKQFTEEQDMRSHGHRRRDGPTTQQRRKHQITYLAYQAKEHELELKNQWAQNKMSRKQTQAKYGF